MVNKNGQLDMEGFTYRLRDFSMELALSEVERGRNDKRLPCHLE